MHVLPVLLQQVQVVLLPAAKVLRAYNQLLHLLLQALRLVHNRHGW